ARQIRAQPAISRDNQPASTRRGQPTTKRGAVHGHGLEKRRIYPNGGRARRAGRRQDGFQSIRSILKRAERATAPRMVLRLRREAFSEGAISMSKASGK